MIENKRLKLIAIFFVIVSVISIFIVLWQIKSYDRDGSDQNPINLTSTGPITAVQGYEKAQKVAESWREDATLAGCGSNETVNGTSSTWTYYFYSPSTEHFFNETLPAVGGGNITVEFVKCDFLIVDIYANGSSNYNAIDQKTFPVYARPSPLKLIIDSDEAYKIAVNNKSIMERIGNRSFNNGIYFKIWKNESVVAICFHPFPTDVYAPEMYACYVSADTGKVIGIDYYG